MRFIATLLTLFLATPLALATAELTPAAATPTATPTPATPTELLAIIQANVGLAGDFVRRLETQKLLAKLGKTNPNTVVPLVVATIVDNSDYTKRSIAIRIAMLELLRDIGLDAGDAVPVLVAIVEGNHPKDEWVRFAATNALLHIQMPAAIDAVDAATVRIARKHAESGTPAQIIATIEQSAFFIRQQLRSRKPIPGVIDAAAIQLAEIGPRAQPAADTLHRAQDDTRLPEKSRELVSTALAAIGYGAKARNSSSRASGAMDRQAEVIADTRHPNLLIQSLAMTELGQLGSSPEAIEALVEALVVGRSPGDAARVLGDFGANAASAVPHLVRYFEDEGAGTNAIQAVGKIGVADPPAVEKLRSIVRIAGHRHRGIAATTLGRLGVIEAVPDLTQLLADPDEHVRLAAKRALRRISPPPEPTPTDGP